MARLRHGPPRGLQAERIRGCTELCAHSPITVPPFSPPPHYAHPPVPTWKMARPGLGGGRRGVMARLFSLDSHSWMVTILRAGGGRCRCVRRAFFRWWKSPSVSVYLRGTAGQGAAPQPAAPPPTPNPHLRPFSWVFLPCSYSAASLKETRRALEELEDRNLSLSASR